MMGAVEVLGGRRRREPRAGRELRRACGNGLRSSQAEYSSVGSPEGQQQTYESLCCCPEAAGMA